MSKSLNMLDDYIEQKLYALRTTTVCRVERVNPNGTYDIQPLVMTKEVGNEDGEKLPLLIEVPAIVQKVKIDGVSKTIEPDYQKGDTVVISFCERDIENALQGRLSLPQDFRRHSLNDPILIGGLS
ncbi:hypothetical protein A6395_13370 [Exiguobacterium sp. SH31]|uniref:Gp138 family membrane-puncturing spike protein n=1 Tax=Exiguobacterium sp. SH31 TaxID=1843183 RepID=UPI0008C1E981|nr:Gp138 family membrane-puncturing spike protein [Exiguobacterium sp. SH31]OGX78206.1 hypothetical protein A6395_13370 [Exiguobacterium sp. SH31]